MRSIVHATPYCPKVKLYLTESLYASSMLIKNVKNNRAGTKYTMNIAAIATV